MCVCGAPPVEERFFVGDSSEERAKIAGDFVEQLLFGGLGVGGRIQELGEIIELTGGWFDGSSLGTEGRVCGTAWSPDFGGVPDVISGPFEEQWEGWDLRIPLCTEQNGAASGAIEVLTGEECAAAGCAGGRADECVCHQDSGGGESIKVGSLHDIIQRSGFETSVGAGVASPVVCEDEEDIGAFCGLKPGRKQQAETGERGGQHLHERWCHGVYPEIGGERGLSLWLAGPSDVRTERGGGEMRDCRVKQETNDLCGESASKL